MVKVDGRIARRNPQRTSDDQYPSVLPRSQQWHRIREYLYHIISTHCTCTFAANLADLYRCVWRPDYCTHISVCLALYTAHFFVMIKVLFLYIILMKTNCSSARCSCCFESTRFKTIIHDAPGGKSSPSLLPPT